MGRHVRGRHLSGWEYQAIRMKLQMQVSLPMMSWCMLKLIRPNPTWVFEEPLQNVSASIWSVYKLNQCQEYFQEPESIVWTLCKQKILLSASFFPQRIAPADSSTWLIWQSSYVNRVSYICSRHLLININWKSDCFRCHNLQYHLQNVQFQYDPKLSTVKSTGIYKCHTERTCFSIGFYTAIKWLLEITNV